MSHSRQRLWAELLSAALIAGLFVASSELSSRYAAELSALGTATGLLGRRDICWAHDAG